ncbi:hypothetical protein, partial [Atlantibacter hermannii]|uniref:hypothetical protein n=1 Tax=Atlantibacter hermannii TaxID=565 RepID=UPI0028AA3C7E
APPEVALMACSGCAARREWIKNWMKIAYERATGKRAADRNGSPDSSDEPTDGVKRGSGGGDLPINGSGRE